MCKRKIPLDGSKARCELNADQAKPADIIEAILLESPLAMDSGTWTTFITCEEIIKNKMFSPLFSPNISNMSKPIFKKIIIISVLDRLLLRPRLLSERNHNLGTKVEEHMLCELIGILKQLEAKISHRYFLLICESTTLP